MAPLNLNTYSIFLLEVIHFFKEEMHKHLFQLPPIIVSHLIYAYFLDTTQLIYLRTLLQYMHDAYEIWLPYPPQHSPKPSPTTQSPHILLLSLSDHLIPFIYPFYHFVAFIILFCHFIALHFHYLVTFNFSFTCPNFLISLHSFNVLKHLLF